MNSSESAEPTAATSYVLDASALLALVLGEPGAEVVSTALHRGAVISTVNLAEVVSRLVRYGWSDQLIESRLAAFSFDAEDFHSAVALRAGFLYRLTSPFGLSLGDRACLALAMALKLPVVTSDRVWSQLDLGVEVVVCR